MKSLCTDKLLRNRLNSDESLSIDSSSIDSSSIDESSIERVNECINNSLSNKSLSNKYSNECSICFDDLDNDNDNPKKELHCGHVFHKSCIDPWLTTNFTCPYCRTCENNIDCYWLWLKPYKLSFLNKYYNYKLVFYKTYIELVRKHYRHQIKLHNVKRVEAKGNNIIFYMGTKKQTILWLKESYGPFNALRQLIDENNKIITERRQTDPTYSGLNLHQDYQDYQDYE